MRVSHDEEHALIAEVLGAHGVEPARAALQATWLVEADLRGHPSHGLQRLPVIAGRIDNGRTQPNAEPELAWASPSALVVDGRHGLGPCVGMAAVDELLARAGTSGIALATVHDASHLGLLAPYVEHVVSSGAIGIALTTSEALVHPWGGRRALVGTNPIAIAIPASPEPFVLDMATSAVSMGRVIHHRASGVPLGPGWAIDADGAPAVDPEAAVALSPFGGAKGYGLGLALELLVAALSGTALGTGVTGTLDIEHPCTKGDVFICLDPAVFGDSAPGERIGAYLDELRSDPGVTVPGDRMRRARAAALSSGIELPDAVWSAATDLLAAHA